uniref:RAB32, member RAS onco family n=1 Tax=Seriola dumerili TaxID=41447 RepID=A0A3B4TY21_SERDU
MAESSVTVCTDKLLKVLVIGDVKHFDERYKFTLGVDFTLKTLRGNINYTDLFSLASRWRFKNMSRVYYKGAMGALVVFDITKSPTSGGKVCLNGGCPIPAVLLANKCDMTGRDGDLLSSLDSFCEDNNLVGWFETSAKDNINIDEAGAFFVKQMMLCDTGPSNEDHHWDTIKVSEAPEESRSRSQSWCCWRPRQRAKQRPPAVRRSDRT